MEEKQLNMPDEHPVPKKKRKEKAGRILLLLILILIVGAAIGYYFYERSQPAKELDKYLRQLYVYSKAVYNLCGRYPDYLEFNCFRTGAWITEPFDREKYIETEKWASELIEKITSTDNWYANGDFFFCNNLCDVCGECEYFEMF